MAASHEREEARSLRPEDGKPGSYAIPRIGVDSRGYTHYWHDRQNVVLVYEPDGTIRREVDLSGRQLKEWNDAVARQIGWEQAPGDWVSTLVDALGEVLEEGGDDV